LVGFGPIQNQLLHFFTITLSPSAKPPKTPKPQNPKTP